MFQSRSDSKENTSQDEESKSESINQYIVQEEKDNDSQHDVQSIPDNNPLIPEPKEPSFIQDPARLRNEEINNHPIQSHPSMQIAPDNTNTAQRPVASNEPFAWMYLDPQGNTQGPFNNNDMMDWFNAGYFPSGLVNKIFFSLGRQPHKVAYCYISSLIPDAKTNY